MTTNTEKETLSIALFNYKLADYAPAIRHGIDVAKQNIDAIVNNTEKPTFSNTIEALEYANEELNKVCSILFNLNECDTSDEMQQIVVELTPEITRFEDSVNMNEKLFTRVKALYDNNEELCLTEEQSKLLDDYYKNFVRSGALLNDTDKKTLADINAELSELTQRFGLNTLNDTNIFTLHITSAEQLAGLPDTNIQAARKEAEEHGKEGWEFTLHQPSYQPFMTYTDNRELREKMWRAYNSRGNRNNDNNNNDIARRIASLRLQKAKLLGYETYCHYIVCERMIQSPEKLSHFMTQLHNAAMPLAKEEVDEIASFAKKTLQSQGIDTTDWKLMPWDFGYYSEKMKKERYNIDDKTLRNYFQLEKVKQGIFALYNKLYGLSFIEAPNVQVYHPDAKVYAVYDKTSNDGNKPLLGLLFMDMYARTSKQGGAWMTEFRGQSKRDGQRIVPLIQVVCNFAKPINGTPSLLTFREVETLMHEMGHAMHGMLSDVCYESLSGTNVLRDFVELPSQLMENWCYETKFIDTIANHYLTGEMLPHTYIQQLQASKRHTAGYLCIRQLNFGKIDLAFHATTHVIEQSAEAIENSSIDHQLPTVDGCCTSTAFTHIFAGGYASGYYGYKWAEVLDADVFSRFKEEGIFNSDTAEKLRHEILSRGGTCHPATMFYNFMGREPDIKAYMHRLTGK